MGYLDFRREHDFAARAVQPRSELYVLDRGPFKTLPKAAERLKSLTRNGAASSPEGGCVPAGTFMRVGVQQISEAADPTAGSGCAIIRAKYGIGRRFLIEGPGQPRQRIRP